MTPREITPFATPIAGPGALGIRGQGMSTRAKPPEITEKQWQRQVVDLAEALGWQWVHFPTVLHTRKDRKSETGLVHRYKTPSEGPLGPGFPDLLLARDRVIFVELKRKGGRMSEDQIRVRDILRTADAEWYLWLPPDFDEAHAVLGRRA